MASRLQDSDASPSPASPAMDSTGRANKHGKESSSATASERKVSCLECRASKVKCNGPEADGSCARCRRIERSCVFTEHRRGRKPAKIRVQKLEDSVSTIMSALDALSNYKRSMAVRRGQNSGSDGGESDSSDEREGADQTYVLEKPLVQLQHFSRKSLRGDGREVTRARDRHPSLAFPQRAEERQTGTSVQETDGRDEAIDAADFSNYRAKRQKKTTISKPETFEDARHPQELGLPSMSNPLKLLIQASDVALEASREESSAQGASGERHSRSERFNTTSSFIDTATQKSDKAGEGTRRINGTSQHGYWSISLYSARPDVGPTLDPVECGFLTREVAEQLYDLYMKHIDERITLLDPVLITFQHVQRHSCLLLTSLCALAARFAIGIEGAEEIADKLDAHIQEVLLPTVLLKGLRSVEIAQAYTILAAYHANTQSLDGDRSWSLVGWAIRVAAELDMNARMLSGTPLAPPPEANQRWLDGQTRIDGGVEENGRSPEEMTQRRLRNRERTWCNLWLFENSIATHMGRRSTLADDPVILGVGAGWHRSPYSIPGDEAIVALIDLRRIQKKNAESLEHSIQSMKLDPSQSLLKNSNLLSFHLKFYCQSCNSDLDAWSAVHTRSDAGDSSLRMRSSSLYASYCRLILNSYALKSTSNFDLLDPFYKESYAAAMTYLSLFFENLDSPKMYYIHNSAVVTVAYVAVFALRLCSLDPARHPYIESQRIFKYVRELAEALERAGSITPWRNGAASSYAPYLRAVLEKVESKVRQEDERKAPASAMEKGQARRSRSAADGIRLQSEERASTCHINDANELRGRRKRKSQSNGKITVGNGSISSTAESRFGSQSSANQAMRPAHTMDVDGARDHQGKHTSASSQSARHGPEALSFVAGPSGVQAGAVLDELALYGEYDFANFGFVPASYPQMSTPGASSVQPHSLSVASTTPGSLGSSGGRHGMESSTAGRSGAQPSDPYSTALYAARERERETESPVRVQDAPASTFFDGGSLFGDMSVFLNNAN